MYCCKTYFSFHYGTYSAEGVVKAGADAGASSLLLANINSTCDIWDFVFHCGQNGIKPIVGAEIRNAGKLLYTLIAANNIGYQWINRFLSDHALEKKPFPDYTTDAAFFNDPGDGFVIYPLGGKEPTLLFSNERIGVQPHEVNKLLTMPLAACRDKWIIRQPVTFHDKVYYNLHRLLRAIDLNTLLSKLQPEDLANVQEYFIPMADMLSAFKRWPFMITNTYRLMDACEITMDFGVDKNKKVFSASREDDRILLEKLAWEGFRSRYGNNKSYRDRLLKELRIIDQMGFTAYFLITWDMIRYAQSRGFYHVGRGSGANSLVAYCLQITDVDPIELDLYFERFLNPQRTSPPDFDIDFSYRDRDEVIDYMMKRYGKEHVALLGMYPTFQYNAIVRELGKVFGLPKHEIDALDGRRMYKGAGTNGGGANVGMGGDGTTGGGAKEGGNEVRKATGRDANGEGMDRITRAILQYGRLLQDFPSGLSIHPGGILISEIPMNYYCAVHMPPKGFPTTMMDMFVAEDIGLHKLDVLSQRGLGHIKECMDLVKQNKQVDIDIRQVKKFKKDGLVKERLKVGDTIGCFYIESPAMRQLIRKLNCDNYETLVAASSIIRPGVGSSGMMKQYILRHHDPTGFVYAHPKLKEVLGSTYGVMIYQEQVIQVAHEWAGLDMADADLLRRAINPKYRNKAHLPMLRERFYLNCAAQGFATSAVEEVWRQIESFAEYSFCKAHSASYAVESYQSLYLKTYYPMEFAVAVINNFGGFYSRELYFYELMKAGARVHRPCVNHSDYYTNIHGVDCYVGFVHIKGLEVAFVEKLLATREQHGAFADVADFVERTGVTQEQLELLIRVDGLRFTGMSKKELLWKGDFLQKKVGMRGGLFVVEAVSPALPTLPVYTMEEIYDDIELLGFPVCDVFLLVDDDPARYVPARLLPQRIGQTVTVLGYHVTHKPVRTVKGEMMSFGTFLDAEMNWIDTVCFPLIHAAHPPQAGFHRITGKVIEEFGMINIDVSFVEKVGLKSKRSVA